MVDIFAAICLGLLIIGVPVLALLFLCVGLFGSQPTKPVHISYCEPSYPFWWWLDDGDN